MFSYNVNIIEKWYLTQKGFMGPKEDNRRGTMAPLSSVSIANLRGENSFNTGRFGLVFFLTSVWTALDKNLGSRD